jgi:hypothetical protein
MRPLLLAALLTLALAVPVRAAEIAGVKLPERLSVQESGPELSLNGAGVRNFLLAKVYVIGLYLSHKASSTEAALKAEGSKRIQIVMLRDATAQQVTDGLFNALARNNTPEDVTAQKDNVEYLRGVLLALEQVPSGTAFSMDYRPGEGTRLLVNGQPKSRLIPGEGFYRVVMRIWLGDLPAQPDLKQALLGG